MIKKKILVITINHVWYDSRLYYKIVKSLLKKNVEILLLTGSQISHCLPEIESFTYQLIPKNKTKFSMLIYFIKQGVMFKPDIVICIEPLSLISGYILKQINKSRFIYDCHEYYAEAFGEKVSLKFCKKHLRSLFTKLYWKFERFFASKTDSIITVNNQLVSCFKKINKNTYLCANYVTKEHLRSLDENVALHSKQGDKESSLSYSSLRLPHLIYVGGLSFEKGLKIYLETAKLFKENDKNYSFMIIGTFKNQTTMQYFFDYITKHDLNDHVLYKPYLPHDIVLSEIKKAKIGVFLGDTSLSNRYEKTIHMKIIEYLSQSKPVIINKLAMLSNLVNDSQGGWIIEYDSKELYDLSINILKDDILLREKGKKGFDFITNNFVWENQEETLYKAVFGE